MSESTEGESTGSESTGSETAESRTAEREATHVTNHWTGIGALALGLGGLGLVTGIPSLVLSGVVGAVFAGYARATGSIPLRDPTTDEPTVSIHRRLGESDPGPGEAVSVTVEVRNDGEGLLTDLRVVDGVPPALEVIEGSPRHGGVLKPGGRTRFTYTVRAIRGEYDWQPATVTVADPAGAVERETSVHSATTLRCTLPATTPPRLSPDATDVLMPGRATTDSGGAGLEFHSTREYRSTDPLSRVDWHRWAKTGELGTVRFRTERSSTVVLVVDARRAAYRAPDHVGDHAVERSIEAANAVFSASLDAGERVGITAFGPSSEECWLPPGSGPTHRTRGRDLLHSHQALSPIPPERSLEDGFRADRREELKRRRIATLVDRLPARARVLYFSPCCDDHATTVARRIHAAGYPVTVVSPDPTTDDGPLRTLAAMERTDRLTALRRGGIRVLDWDRDEPFPAAAARLETRWSG